MATVAPVPKENFFARLVTLYNEVLVEMKKVTWPTKNEVVGTTVVVIVSTIVFALFRWGCDVVFYKAIDFLFTRFGASI